MLDQEHIQKQLRQLLPPEMHGRIPDLIQLLANSAGAQNQKIAQSTKASLRPLFEQLAGKYIQDDQAQISFGADNSFNTITIGDVARGNITKLTVTFTDHPLTIRRLRLVFVGIALLVVLVGVVIYLIQVRHSQEVEQARQIIHTDVNDQLMNVDDRLDFVATVIQDIPPANAAATLQELINTQKVASLKQAFNSRPLVTHPNEALLQLLTNTKAHPEQVWDFYNNLNAVQDDSESLLTTLQSLGHVKNGESDRYSYYQKLLDFDSRMLTTSSQISYLTGLMTLYDLETPPDEAIIKLGARYHFAPDQLQHADALEPLLEATANQLEELVNERKALIEEAIRGLSADLIVKPDDPWNVVVGKAIAIRKLGNIEGAVLAFQRYGEMFSETDSTAAQYAHGAQLFTQQIGTLGLEGAVYVYEVKPNSFAQAAHIQVGDIVTKINDTSIPNAPTFETVTQQLPQDQAITLIILRLQADGSFSQMTISIPKTPIGINVMPI